MRINITLLLILFFLFSCRKFIETDPPATQIVRSTVFTTMGGGEAAINGIYSQMMNSSGFASGGNYSIGFLAGLSADELQNYSPDADLIAFSQNAVPASSPTINNALWQESFTLIYQANAMIEGLTASALPVAQRDPLIGEAKFVRAFCHFYLANLFGDLPIVTTTNYPVNNQLMRSPREKVYDQVQSDLADAEKLLPENYVSATGNPTEERVRPNKYAAKALQARLALYRRDWAEAKKQSSVLLSLTSMYSLSSSLHEVFLKNSSETIWQLMPVIPGINTNDYLVYVLTGTPNNAVISSSLLNSFEPGDQRRQIWVDSLNDGQQTYFYPSKYKVFSATVTEYQMVFRLAEQYLIRAEANAELDDLPAALADLNLIRNRAGLTAVSFADRASVLQAIEQERRVEFFTEWGQRWFDLARTGRATEVLGPLKSPNWEPTDTLFPVPAQEIIRDPKLSQNPGY